jgi:gluconate 2-dehydrogenase gamma chain
MIDRRELLHRTALLLGGAISSSAAAGILSGCAAAPPADETPTQTTAFFTPAEAATVSAMAEQILPRTDTPGALDAGVPAFIDRMMAGFYQDNERAALRAGLARVDRDAQSAHRKSFASLTSDQQIALMQVYDKEAYDQTRNTPSGSNSPPHFFRTMKELTTLGFFTSREGATKFLKYVASPGPYRGDVPYSEIGAAWAT